MVVIKASIILKEAGHYLWYAALRRLWYRWTCR